VTPQDAVYGEWLNILGSDELYDRDPGIAADLKLLHDGAEDSHPQPEALS
jgi:hypothetical protein